MGLADVPRKNLANEWMDEANPPWYHPSIRPSIQPNVPLRFRWLLKTHIAEESDFRETGGTVSQTMNCWNLQLALILWQPNLFSIFQFFSSSKWGVQRLVEAKGVDMATGESLSRVFFPWWTFLFQTRRQAELIFWGFKLSTSIMTSGIAFSIGDGLYPRWTLGSWLWCRTQHFLELVFPYGIFKGWSALAGLCHWISVACILTDSFDN